MRNINIDLIPQNSNESFRVCYADSTVANYVDVYVDYFSKDISVKTKDYLKSEKEKIEKEIVIKNIPFKKGETKFVLNLNSWEDNIARSILFELVPIVNEENKNTGLFKIVATDLGIGILGVKNNYLINAEEENEDYRKEFDNKKSKKSKEKNRVDMIYVKPVIDNQMQKKQEERVQVYELEL